MNIREEITNKIIAAIEAGTPPWRKGWSGGALCCNAQTGKPYQGVNQMLLGMSGFEDNRWLTFKQARKLGLQVRKGERSTKIVRMVEVERKAAERENDSEVVSVGQGRALVMRLYDLFNAAQVDGMASRPERIHAIAPVAAAEAMIEGLKRTGLDVRHGYPDASYSVVDDLIRMPDQASFHNTGNRAEDYEYWATLMHEAIHSTGSHKRLQRLIPSARFDSQERAKEELVAEVGAAMLCCDLGIGIGQAKEHLENHSAYIASWLTLLKQDKNEIFRAAAAAQRAFDYMREHALDVKLKLVQQPKIEVPEPIAVKRRGPRM